MAADSTWGIPKPVRSVLAARVTELRVALTEDARRQLAALGLSANGIGAPPGGRSLSVEEAHAREVVLAVLDAGRHAGISYAESLDGYLDAVAFTLLDRLVAFRCLEERGLLLMDGQPETLVRTDPARGVPSIIWRVRAEQPGFDARSVAREAYRRAGAAMTERVKLLFDPDDEPSAIFPTLPVWQRALEALNDPAIPVETWATDELMGWVYQYWSSQLKDKVYAKLARGGKIEDPSELAAATALYTERYIVDYLVQNTLGAIWVEMHPDSKLPDTWPYYVRAPEGNAPAERAPKRVRDLTLIDPCVGSGHFLVRAFELFAQLYAEEGIEDPAQVPALILEHNLFGADIDRRAVQIAALALYLKGCERAGTDFRPRQLNLVACDIAIPPDPPDDFLASLDEPELKELARSLWTGLAGIRTFGSLLHPERAVNETFAMLKSKSKGTLWETETDWGARRKHFIAELRTAFTGAANETDLSQHLFGEEASRGLTALEVLGGRYDVVVTNPPYQGAASLPESTRKLLVEEYAAGKRDLYAAFILRCRQFAREAGRVGMVTQQSWMLQSSFEALREDLVATTTIATVAHLGSRAFEEISGEVVNTAAFVFVTTPPIETSDLVGYRLIAYRTAAEKAGALTRGVSGADRSIVHTVRQRRLKSITGSPLLYSVTDTLLSVLGSEKRLASLAPVKEGITTADNDRFVRYFWEVEKSGSLPLTKGGGYGKWYGQNHWVLDWTDGERPLRQSRTATLRNLDYWRRPGWTYTQMAGGALGVRMLLPGTALEHKGPAVLSSREGIAAVLNSRIASYFARALGEGMEIRTGTLERIPFPGAWGSTGSITAAAVCLKATSVSARPPEATFVYVDNEIHGSVKSSNLHVAILHALEGWNERLVFDAYKLGAEDVQAVIDETGAPAGWNPLIVGYDALPEPPAGIDIPDGLTDFLASLEHHQLAAAELAAVKARLLAMYEAGPGAKEEVEEPTAKRGDEEEAAGAALGARIPIPTETFLEELSVKLELHPISVHWLLEELRAEGVVSPPLRKAELEEYLDVTLVRMLGYRWPEQDAYEAEHGPILDPDLMDADGIIPLVPCGDERTAEQRVTDRLVRAFGEDGAEAFLRDVRKYLKRDLGAWIAKDFFKVHTKRFKNRPIAWHLRSPEGHFEALVLYHRLSRETLAKLRVTYAGDRLARLRADQTRARERKDDRAVSDLQLAIEDVEAFRSTLEAIERGSELKHRIRCRWKNETESGRPGPYAPDIDDGVKVNIRPFQESGLLPTKVISKW